MKSAIAIGAIVLAVGFAYARWPVADQSVQTAPETGSTGGSTALAKVRVPDVQSPNAQIGSVAYNAKCAACHGVNAAGQDGIAPPLVHRIYEPSHHADESFQRAAALGVRAHHWSFGDMPTVEGLTRGDVAMITAYIRELQRANDIN